MPIEWFRRLPRSLKRAVVAGVVVTVTGPLITLGVAVVANPEGLEGAIRRIDFHPIKPPSGLTNVGSLYHVTDRGRRFRPVCKVDSPDLQFFPSEEIMGVEHLNSAYAFDALIPQSLKQEMKLQNVTRVTYSLKDVRIGEASYADLGRILQELEKDAFCKQQLDRLLSQDEFVCPVQAVLVGSGQLHFGTVLQTESQSRSDSEGATRPGGAIEIQTDASAGLDEQSISVGEGLHYGIRLSGICLTTAEGPIVRLPSTRLGWYLRDLVRAVSRSFS